MECLCITGYLPGSQRFVKSLRQFAGTSSRCHSRVESGNIPIELEYGPVELDFMGLLSNKGESYIVTGRMDEKKTCLVQTCHYETRQKSTVVVLPYFNSWLGCTFLTG